MANMVPPKSTIIPSLIAKLRRRCVIRDFTDLFLVNKTMTDMFINRPITVKIASTTPTKVGHDIVFC